MKEVTRTVKGKLCTFTKENEEVRILNAEPEVVASFLEKGFELKVKFGAFKLHVPENEFIKIATFEEVKGE